MKHLTILAGLLALIATAAFISFAPLRAEDPAPANVEKMFKEIKSDLQEIKTELAEIKKALAELKAAPVKPEPHPANQDEAALKVAGQWIAAIFDGDLETAMSLMDVPFAFEEGEIILTKEKLREKFKELVKGAKEEDMGIDKVSLEIAKSYKPGKKEEKLLESVLPKGGVFVRARHEDEKDLLILYIRPGENPKVVGFRD